MKAHANAASAVHALAHRSAARFSFVLVLLAGCSSRSSGDGPLEKPASIAECDAYLAAHATCLTSAGSEVAAEMGKSHDALASRLAAAATGDDAARERMRATCASGEKLLTASCK